MKPHVHADLIHAWADGAEIEWLSIPVGWLDVLCPQWSENNKYRIKDPYRHLKEAAADPTKQVRYLGGPWHDGGSTRWEFGDELASYEVRDKPKPKVRMWQWVMKRLNGSVYLSHDFYLNAPTNLPTTAKPLFPAPWTEIEVEA